MNSYYKRDKMETKHQTTTKQLTCQQQSGITYCFKLKQKSSQWCLSYMLFAMQSLTMKAQFCKLRAKKWFFHSTA